MLKHHLIHSKRTHLAWLFKGDHTYWYDSNPIWEIFSKEFPHSNEITDRSIIFCSTETTYRAQMNSGANYFIMICPVETIAPSFQAYPIHKDVWMIQPTLSVKTPPLKFLKFPAALKNVLCFNGTKHGPLLLVRASRDKFGSSDILLFLYSDLNRGKIVHKGAHGSTVLEDPRLFHYNGALYSTYTVIKPYITGVPTTTHLGYCAITGSDPIIPKFGKNFEKGPEKNWGFFSSGRDILHAIYSYSPWKILRISGEEATQVYEQEFPKGAPTQIHGGTCPTFHDGKWWVFGRNMEHSLERGSIICVVFDPISFQIVAWAPVSFLSAVAFSHYLFYIGSAEIANGQWTCVGGFNDAAIVELKFPHEDLIKELNWIS